MTRNLRNLAAMAIVAVMLGGCSGMTFSCAGWKKFQVSRNDGDQTKAQAAEHNKYGRLQGCWD